MAYNNDLDYTTLIRQAADNGDLATAAALEASRNEKIDSEGLGYSKTSDFSNYLGTNTQKSLGSTSGGTGIDYSIMLKNMMENGASAGDVSSVLQSRVNKATSTPGLSQYAYDDVYKAAKNYVAQNQSQSNFDSLLDSVINREPFSYDPKTDPVYISAATSAYNRGKAASSNALAEAASLTGGLPSSAAVSAAAAAQNEYNSQLSEMVPSFRNQAYSEYQNGLATDLSTLSTLQSERGYKDSREDAATGKAYEMAVAMIKTGMLPSDSMLDEAGIEKEYAQQMVQQYLKTGGTGSGSGSGSGSGGGGGTPKIDEGDNTVYQSIYDSGIRSEGDAYAYLLASGYNTTQAGKLAKYFSSWLEDYNDDETTTPTASKASLNFSQDEGIFTWNGKNYSKTSEMLNDMEKAGLSDDEKNALKKKFKMFGFDVNF